MGIIYEQIYQDISVCEESGLHPRRKGIRISISGRNKSFVSFTASEIVLKSTLCSQPADEIMTRKPMMALERIHFTPGIQWMSNDPFLFCLKNFFYYEKCMD